MRATNTTTRDQDQTNTVEPGPRTPTVDVVCHGSAYDLGLQQGAALQSKISATLRALRDLEVFRLEKPSWMPFGMFRRCAERKVRTLWASLEKDWPEMAQRLAGLAAGSGATRCSLWLLNALEPLVANLDGKTVVPPPGACSAVALRARRTATGEPVLARNFDFLPLMQPFYSVRESRPRGGFRSLDFILAPLGGTVDGINEHGLAITYDYAYVRDQPTASGTISMSITSALERCATVTEAIAQLSSRPRWGGGILMLADATGDIASLELSNSRSAVRRPDGGEDHIFHTNRFQSPDLRQVEVEEDCVFAELAPKALRGKRVHESSDCRDGRFAQLLATRPRFDQDDLQALLADHGPAEDPGDNTICTHGSYWYTTATLQLFPRQRRMRIAYDTACRAKFTEIQL